MSIENDKVVSISDFMEQGKYAIDYVFDKDGKLIGVSHPDWPFTIMRNQETKAETAIVCNTTDEAFGALDSDIFNTIVMCWLLIDDPNLIDEAAKDITEEDLK